jgi:hypothetical protein
VTRYVLPALLAGLAWIGTASAGTATRVVSYRVIGVPWDLGESDACPDGTVRYGIDSAAGKRIGTADICVRSASKRDKARYGVVATVTLTGTVGGGTGRYAHARGTVSGGGPMTVDGAGEHPRLTVVVRLR